jgi:segregation and condensation protein B
MKDDEPMEPVGEVNGTTDEQVFADEVNIDLTDEAGTAEGDIVKADTVEADTVEDDSNDIDAGVHAVEVAGLVQQPEDDADQQIVSVSINQDELRRALEAILMVADQPVDANLLAQLLELPIADVDALCMTMAAAYEDEGRGFILVEVAGGWRFQSHPSQAPYVERFALDGQVSRLSGAALETLAIVAYKQPISRAQIAQIRGVNVDGVMRTLAQKGYVAEIGTDPGPGQAVLFGTTPKFLESMGMAAISDLAPLADFVPGAEIMEALEAGLRMEAQVEPLDVPPAAAAPVEAAPAASPAE